MRKLKYLILAVGTLFVIASCDDNIPQSFNAEDSNASFSKTTASVNENATEPLEIPLVLAGIPGSGKVTVTLAVSTEGDTNPAIEGEDFTIDNKEITFEEGYGTQNIVIRPIDNNVFTGKKTFTLTIAGSTPELKESVQNSVKISIADDEHPLSYLFGTYAMEGILISQGQASPNGYDVTIAAHDAGALNEIEVDFGYPEVVLASVGEEDGETVITFYKNQDVGEAQAGYIAHFVWTTVEDGKQYYSETDNVMATYDNGIITLNEDNGFGFLAYESGVPYAWFEYWMQGSVTFTKK